MATNFGNTYMEGSIEPSVRVQAPVQDNSGAVLANALAPAAGQLGAMIGSIFKGQQEDASNKILVDYEMELLDLGDAVSQGSMNKNEARMHASNLRRKYLGLAPALRGEFDGVWSKFAGANGLGHVTITGTDEEQRIIARENAAAALGYTPEEYSLFESRLRQATEINYQLDLLQKQGSTITETQRLQGLQAVVGMSQAAYPNAQRRINEAMAAIQADPSQKATIMAQVNQVIGQGIAEVEHLSGSADGSYITTPIKSALDTFNKWANGEVELGAMENELKSVKLQYDLMYATDPTLGPAIAASRIIGELGMTNSTLFQQIFTTDVITRLAEVSSGKPVNFLTNTKDITGMVEATKAAAATISPDDVEGNKQIMDVVNKAVDSVFLNERSADGPTAYKEVIELLASPEIKAVIDRNGGISSQYAKQFAGVLAQAYDQELLAASARFLEDTDVTDLESIRFTETGSTAEVLTGPVSDFIEPRWNGNAVEFVPKAGYETNPNVVRLANSTTTGSGSIGDPLNNLIRAHANVAGMEPKQVWEERFARQLFNVEPPSISDRVSETLDRTGDPSYTPEEDSELTLSDFNPTPIESNLDIAEVDTSSFQPLNSSSFIEPASNPAVDKQVLDKFAGRRLPVSIRNNNMGAVSITGNISNSWAAKQPGFVGTTPRPANEGGYYAKYATPEHGVAAASKLLELYGRQGVDSPAAIVRKWSVDRAAHTSYANTLVKYLKEAGIEASSSTPIDLSDPKVRMAVLKAKSSHEAGAGRPVYNDQTFLRGVTYQL